MNDVSPSPHTTSATGPIPWSEWAVALIGLLLVAGAIGYLAYLAAFVPERPADVVATVEHVGAASAGHRVDVRVENRGGTTAAEVKIEGRLARDGAAVETSDVTFDFVPPNSERRATLMFRSDPGGVPPEVRVIGFREP
ncbi:hypothetical protein [Azospirillum sp. ST 5-10]|uniref:hypothetical protein n=1 Tax=unclassified Azospirillum TaxID=2630922 RepID=UPI003F4A1C4C